MKTQKKRRPAEVESQWKVDLTNSGSTVSHENLDNDHDQQGGELNTETRRLCAK